MPLGSTELYGYRIPKGRKEDWKKKKLEDNNDCTFFQLYKTTDSVSLIPSRINTKTV